MTDAEFNSLMGLIGLDLPPPTKKTKKGAKNKKVEAPPASQAEGDPLLREDTIN